MKGLVCFVLFFLCIPRYLTAATCGCRYSTDFGKNDSAVLKWVSEFLDTPKQQQVLDLLENYEVKLNFQPYDWSVNR